MAFDNVFAHTEQLTLNFLIGSAVTKWHMKFLIDHQCFSKSSCSIISTLSRVLRSLTYETGSSDEIARVFGVEKEGLFWCEVWLDRV